MIFFGYLILILVNSNDVMFEYLFFNLVYLKVMMGNCFVFVYLDGLLFNVIDGNYEVLWFMSIGKRKLGLENGIEGWMDLDEYGNWGLSEVSMILYWFGVWCMCVVWF